MLRIVLSLFLVTSFAFSFIEFEVEKARFKRGNGTLIDTFADLEWQDNKDAKTVEKSWIEKQRCKNKSLGRKRYFNTSGDTAESYCKHLSLNGKNDWRLPTLDELKEAYNINEHFKNVSDEEIASYWTSTSYSTDTSSWRSARAYRIRFKASNDYYLGDVSDQGKCVKENVRCVRSNNPNPSDDLANKIENAKNKKIKELKNIKENKIAQEYNGIKKKNTISSYKNFINKYPNSSQSSDAWQSIYKLSFEKSKQKNTQNAYMEYIKSYPNSQEAKKALELIYKMIKKENSIEKYEWFIKKYSNASQIKNCILGIYKIIKSKNNIAGYEWFVKKYPTALEIKDAVQNIHKLAFEETKKINTISSYNTFIISYPYAKEVNEALSLLKKAQIEKYTELDKDDEKKARLIAVKIKKMTFRMKKATNKSGYEMIINLMSNILTEKYEATDASLRYYESKEFTDFVSKFDKTMKDVKRILNKISSNTSNISQYTQKILDVSSEGFADAKADRDLALYKTQEHRKWEKFMHFRDKGYQ